MSDGFYLDNDIVLKSCAYGVGVELVEVTTTGELKPALLALARYTLMSRINRSRTLVNRDDAAAQLGAVLDEMRLLEPTVDELQLAAEFEDAAIAANLSFDAGESQLMAMLITRSGLTFLTGDKRAVRAMSVIIPELVHRLACLEQVLHTIIQQFGIEPMRASVCREHATDRAVTNCFQCSAYQIDPAAILEGLESYSRALRAETGHLLLETADISGAKIS